MWLGKLERTGENLIGTPKGLVTSRSIARRPVGDNFGYGLIQSIRGTPWNPTGVAEHEPVSHEVYFPQDDYKPPDIKQSAERRTYFSKKLLDEYGRTKGCPGCKGKGAHWETCRERLQQLHRTKLQTKIDELESQILQEEKDKGGEAPAADSTVLDDAPIKPRAPQVRSQEEEVAQPGDGPSLKRSQDDLNANVPSDSRAAPSDKKIRFELEDGPTTATDVSDRPVIPQMQVGGSSSSSSVPMSTGTPQATKRDALSWLDQATLPAAKSPKTKTINQVYSFHRIAQLPTNSSEDEFNIPVALKVLATTIYYDDISGGVLDPKLVKEARSAELADIDKYGVWKIVPRSQSGKQKVVTLRWVDVNKGDDANPEIRSRLVARQLKAHGGIDLDSLFAATPPYAMVNVFLSFACTFKSRRGLPYKISFKDVRRAYFHACATEEIFCELPAELAGKFPGCIVLLLKSLYGTRSAAKNWQMEVTRFFVDVCKFVQAASSPCLYYHFEEDIAALVHGDDIYLLSDQVGLDYVEPRMRETWPLKENATLGPDEHDDKLVQTLNRYIRWVDGVGIEVEADPRHAELIQMETGMERSSGSTTPGVSLPQDIAEKDEKETIHDSVIKTAFRAVAARGLYLSVDRPETKFATKEVARMMHSPTISDLQALKRLGKFMKKRPRLARVYHFQGEVVGKASIEEFFSPVDSNWADCKRSCKSTSGGAIKVGKHSITEWSITQSTVSLSSGEAEFYAILRGAQEGLAIQAMAKEMGRLMKLVIGSDSTAAKLVVHRHGLGRLKHLQIRHLWIQQAVAQRRFKLIKIPGATNYADLMTKHSTESKMLSLLTAAGYEYRDGREPTAPQLLRGVAQCRFNQVQMACAIIGL